jgi:CubicO group peptidase (beta-lactamase class C family)
MRKTIYALTLALTILLSSIPISARQEPDPFKDQLEPIIKQAMQKLNLPGFAIAVVQNDRVVYAAGFGLISLDNKTEPITSRSLFHMASITKLFVGTSIMQLVEQGKIDLDAPIVKYLPYFRMKDDRYKAITVRQMLSHVSGMPDVGDYEWDKPQYDDGALERYVRSLNNLSLIAAPGAKFQYSNMAYEILGDCIAKVSGETFEGYVKNHILDPLGMKNSTLLVKQADQKLLTTPHVFNKSFDIEVSKVFPYNRMHSPSSTLYSNVLDMAEWARASINRGELNGKRILKSTTYDAMWRPAGEEWKQIGISWFLGEYKGHRTMSHSGGDTGFNSNFTMIPDKKIAVVMMSNFDNAIPAMRVITNAALDVALGLKPESVPVKQNIAVVIYKAIANEGIDAAIQKYRDLKKNQPDAYNFQEALLNRLGYNLMQQGKLKEAIGVFQLNVEAYPASGNVYDSLGEAYMKNGDKQLAIENYEKSLKLDPGNSNAVEMLKKLKGN